MISGPAISERRAAAARANGAKSRGRHGLRSRVPFDDPEFHQHQADLLASLTRDLRPQSDAERSLVKATAVSHWCRTLIWNLEATVLNQEMRRSKSQMSVQEGAIEAVSVEALSTKDSDRRLAPAFRTLSGHSRSLELLNRFAGRFERQFSRAYAGSKELRAHGSGSLETPIIADRTQQVIENKTDDELIQEEPKPISNPQNLAQHYIEPKRQTVMDHPSAQPARECALPNLAMAAGATQTP